MARIPGCVSPSLVYSGIFKSCNGPSQRLRSSYPILRHTSNCPLVSLHLLCSHQQCWDGHPFCPSALSCVPAVFAESGSQGLEGRKLRPFLLWLCYTLSYSCTHARLTVEFAKLWESGLGREVSDHKHGSSPSCTWP